MKKWLFYALFIAAFPVGLFVLVEGLALVATILPEQLDTSLRH